MGKIDEAIQSLDGIEDLTERALQLAGLISTLFKLKGVILVATGELAFDSYANTSSEHPEVELAAFAGDLTPRAILEIMRGQLGGFGTIYHWVIAGIPVRFQNDTVIANRELCRDFTTDHGVVKLVPVEEITADYILAAVYPDLNAEAHDRAHLLLMNGLAEVIHMDWTALHALCHRPDYRVGEDLARMRLAAKREIDALGLARDHIGETSKLPSISATPPPSAEQSVPVTAPVDEVNVVVSTEAGEVAEPLPEK